MNLLGLDEAGRGAWAGPLVVGAVLGDSRELNICRDSKSLSPGARAVLCRHIQKRAEYIGLGWSSSAEIDQIGIEQASIRAAHRAISALSHYKGEIIVDGRRNWLTGLADSKSLVRADTLVRQVSAASIVAKVFRDSWMRNSSSIYSLWKFDSNKGYGTKQHRQSLEEFGSCAIHRFSYKPLLGYPAGE